VAPEVQAPTVIDASAPADAWILPSSVEAAAVDMVIAINVTHIAPWEATTGLVAGAGRLLRPGGRLCIYGPFLGPDGGFTTESNKDFDANLRSRDTRWGYRDVRDIEAEAKKAGFSGASVMDMPANNQLIAFVRS